MSNQKTPVGAFATLVVIFFFWGFVAASNDILIPVFKEALNLEQWQSQMISFAFYVAYTVGAAAYFIASKINGKDILNKIGYRNGLALGLLISAAGTLLFIPAANNASFPLLLGGLFIVGLGFALQQTAANPLAIVMGDPKQGSQRLSLAGGVNNVGTTIGPVIIAIAIFGSASGSGETALSLSNVKTPYLILGAAFLLAAAMFKFSSVPDQINLEDSSEKSHPNDHSVEKAKSVFSYPNLTLGMLAIFCYVGVEVSTASNLPEFMKEHTGINSSGIAPYVSLFWGSLMIGRWTSAAGAFNISKTTKLVLNVVLPFVAFGIFILANYLGGHDLGPFKYYWIFIIGLIVLDYLSGGKPARQLLIYSLSAIVALIFGIYSEGMTAAFAFISVGLFCSTLWPCIFTLGITGLGKATNEGSSLLIMMICGGGFISLLQGHLASPEYLGIQNSYWVGVACFAYLAFYAFKTRNLETGEMQGGH
ncbi:MAG: MFS transporter [Flavobacteriales bacterium]